MPKNINIQEGGDPKYMNEVKYIMTNLQGSGTCLWVPVDDVKLGTKTITKNGSYSASKSGFYGFEKVIVNVPGGDSNKTNNGKLADEDGNEAKDENGNSITPAPSGGSGSSVSGTDPDDGNDYKVDVDENGNLTKTKLPSRIEVTRNPDKINYTSGETLNPSGIIVHAYYGDGTDYGTVLNSELGYDPMTLEADDEGDTIFTQDGITAVGLYYSEPVSGYYSGEGYGRMLVGSPDEGTSYWNKRSTTGYLYFTQYNGNVYVTSHDGDGNYGWSQNNNGRQTGSSPLCNGNITSNHFSMVNNRVYNFTIPTSNVDPTTVVFDNPQNESVEITVRWNRPADGKVLTTTFVVNVNGSQSSGENSGGGGSHGF